MKSNHLSQHDGLANVSVRSKHAEVEAVGTKTDKEKIFHYLYVRDCDKLNLQKKGQPERECDESAYMDNVIGTPYKWEVQLFSRVDG